MDKNDFMKLAISEGQKCLKTHDVPVGAVIVKNDKVVAFAHNLKEKKRNCLCHAELLAISKASKKLKNFRLSDCDIYVTKEPCLMCMGAILSARIRKVYFGASDKRFGTINLAKENGGIDYTYSVLEQTIDKANKIVDNLNLSSNDLKESFLAVIQYLKERKY